MPASETFARLGLVAAVTVVVGISTLGPLLRQGPQPEGRLVALAAVVPPPSPAPAPVAVATAADRSTGLAATEPAPSTRSIAGATPPSPPAQSTAREPAPAFRTAVAVFTLDDAAPAPKVNSVQTATADPSGGVVPSEATGAFPSVQALDDDAAAQAAQAAAAALAAKKAKRAAELRAAAKKKAATRPQPFNINDFFAGRL
jgi:hypothetical protein